MNYKIVEMKSYLLLVEKSDHFSFCDFSSLIQISFTYVIEIGDMFFFSLLICFALFIFFAKRRWHLTEYIIKC